jgi:hypothetical protein
MSAQKAPAPETVGRQAMIIVGALLTGMVMCACVTVLMARAPAAEAPAILSVLGLGGAGMTLLLRLIVPTAIAQQAVSTLFATDSDQNLRQGLAGVYLTKVMIGAALLEGAGFFNLVVSLITRSPWNLGAAGVMATVMAVTFPSQAQFDAWADRTLRDRA